MKPEDTLKPNELRIVLILQGASALGAYQAGAYQALHENGLAPDWIIGASIGAINAALIAGNPPATRVDRLAAFWQRGCVAEHPPKAQRRSSVWYSAFDTVFGGFPGFFAPRPFGSFAAGQKVDPEEASFYDAAPLTASLAELVDFARLNAADALRVTINAMCVRSGELIGFDNRRQALAAAHVRAACATPPGFAAVRIERQLYWDAGVNSNAALATLLDDLPHVDTLCFMVDPWHGEDAEPTTLAAVQARREVASFAARSKRLIADYLRAHFWQRRLRELAPQPAAGGGDCVVHLVRLPYAGNDWNKAVKDVDFSPPALRWRWDQGYRTALRAIEHAAWRTTGPAAGLLVHELPPAGGDRRAAGRRA